MNILFTRVLRIFFSRNLSAAIKYQVGFSAFGGDSVFRRRDGVLAWKVEPDS